MTATPPRPSGRALHFDRRPPLPSGRAALGGLLIATAALGAFATARGGDDPAPPERVVARRDLAPDTPITDADVALAAADVPGADANLFTTLDDVVGTVTLAPLSAGDVVHRSAVAERRDGLGAAAHLSLPVDDAAALSGHLQTGERVDVLATFGTGPDAHTRRVATGVRILEVDAPGDRLTSALTLTVAIDDPAQVLPLAHAVHAGTPTIVRSGGRAPSGPDDVTTPDGDEPGAVDDAGHDEVAER